MPQVASFTSAPHAAPPIGPRAKEIDRKFYAAVTASALNLKTPTFQAGFLSHLFDKIYVINLKDRTDRYRETETQLALAGLSFSHPSVERVEALQPEDTGPFDSVGARGCFLSHLEVLRRATDAGHQSILILEDDIEWSKTALSIAMMELQTLAATPWEFLHGGNGEDSPSTGALFGLEPLAPQQEMRLAHFIGLRGGAIHLAKANLEALLKNPVGSPAGGPMHVDGAYSWLRRQYPYLRSYVCAPALAQQRSSRSDISPPTGWKANPVVQKVLDGVRYLRWISQETGLWR